MTGKQEKLLERHGWEIIGTTPLQIRKQHEDVGFDEHQGQGALDVLAELEANVRTSILPLGSGGKYPAKKQ